MEQAAVQVIGTKVSLKSSVVIGKREGVSELGLVTWIFPEAVERLEWLAGISSNDIALTMVNGSITLPPALCLIPTLRYDRYALCLGCALFLPFPYSPTHRCHLTTGADGLPYGICSQLRPLPPFQPVSTPRARPKREAQIRRCVGEQVLIVYVRPGHADLHLGRNADVPRALVRDMYTKSWSAFDRLVDIVPPGGSIG